jgi:sulfoxide reductase catalytic subunit YedY
MAHIIIRPEWHIAEKDATPEQVYWRRREFLKQLGYGGASALLAMGGVSSLPAADAKKGYPYPRNKEFNPGWALTDENVAGKFNNFYEFTTSKKLVHTMVDKFVITPWQIEIGGLVEKPLKLDVRELIEMFPLEERVYRFRCVEGWSMVVPWTGFQLSKLIERVQPKAEAKFVKFVTFNRPDQAPGMKRNYPWPYTEGLRMDEAMHPLTLVTTGVYGKPLPKQFGAPIRMIVPWKYGYKGGKSIERIEFVATQPKTFWEALSPEEYPFESNVDPAVPHPRWSQATEEVIDTGLRIRTQKYNGYGEQVGKLYGKG